MRKIKVGIIQQANVADMRINLMNLAKSIESCAAHGAQLVVLQELHNSLYFCQTENFFLFVLFVFFFGFLFVFSIRSWRLPTT